MRSFFVRLPWGGAFALSFNLRKEKEMKKTLALLLALVVLTFGLVSCVWDKSAEPDAPIYTEDTELGSGAVTVTVKVVMPDGDVTFTLHTDKLNLADALLEHNLIEGEEGAYGLYVKKVNGVLADYDVNASYWALMVDGEYAMTGMSDTPITEGTFYEIVYTK